MKHLFKLFLSFCMYFGFLNFIYLFIYFCTSVWKVSIKKSLHILILPWPYCL
jgi:hypothetical protein